MKTDALNALEAIQNEFIAYTPKNTKAGLLCIFSSGACVTLDVSADLPTFTPGTNTDRHDTPDGPFQEASDVVLRT